MYELRSRLFFSFFMITRAAPIKMKPNLTSCHTSSTGVNVPDHDMTFQSLSELLQQSVTPHVASVQAKECGGNRLLALLLILNA